jgi:putative transposase
VEILRNAIGVVRQEMPFEIVAAVILPDHMHFLWALPSGDDSYSKRIGRMKVHFTREFRGIGARPRNTSKSRQKHCESDVWQRRFWEHTVRDEHDFDRHFDYIHYNPVKHGLVSCPHQWKWTSFHRWVERRVCDHNWGCNCRDRQVPPMKFDDIADSVGE